jgi:PD-(D/E)XK nuclease superfamily protein
MPRIFTVIDAQMREHYAGKRTRDAMPFLPPGVIDSSASWVQSVPLSMPSHTSTCTIRGKLDAVVRFDDSAYGVIDFKTSGTRSQHTPLYSRQLHAYALALEKAASGNLSLSPVTKLGLVVFEPSSFSNGNIGPASLIGSVNWIEIPRVDSGFIAFLKEVLNILELPTPPDSSPSCEWCQYRDASRRTGL